MHHRFGCTTAPSRTFADVVGLHVTQHIAVTSGGLTLAPGFLREGVVQT